MTESAATPPESIDPCAALQNAAAAGAPCALRWSTRADGEIDRATRTRSAFVDEQGFVVALSPSDAASLGAVAAGGGKVLATIRQNDIDSLFVTRVVVLKPRGDGDFLATLALPTRLLATSRRELFRIDLSEGDLREIVVSVWRIKSGVPLRDRVMPSQSVRCALHDLSGNGARMTLTPRQGGTIESGQRLRIELAVRERTMRFDGRVRDVVATAAGWRCGVQFVDHAHEFEMRQDRETLHRVLADLQRRALHRRAA